MTRPVLSRLVATTVAFTSVLTLGLAASHGGHRPAAHATALTSTRDRGWCC